MGDSLNGRIKSIQFKTLKLNEVQNDVSSIELNLNYHERYYDNKAYIFNFDVQGNLVYEQAAERNIERKFNEKNQVTEVLIFNLGSDKWKNKQTYKYANSKVIEVETYHFFHGYECLVDRKTFNYDKNLNFIESITRTFLCEKSTDVPKDQMRSIAIFNIDNNKVIDSSFNAKGELHAVTNYKYDKKKRLISEFYTPTYNNSNYSRSYAYDNKNRLIQKTEINKEGIVNKSEAFKFNPDNTLDEKEITFNSKVTHQYKYKYREKKLFEEYFYIGGQLNYRKLYSYDKKGNTNECLYFDNKDIAKRKYELLIEYY